MKVTYNAFGYASGSVLFEIGNTKVLCAANLQTGVPQFLKGTRTGWLSAEYAMLPTATVERTAREAVTQKRCGRGTEISRLIGRALRAIVDLNSIGERTITIDCDVLQADGGTRTAAISGSYLALMAAQQYWLDEKFIAQKCITGDVAAISVGMIDGVPLLDLSCAEDNVADADFNFMLTSAGHIIEIQGAVEKDLAISWADFEKMSELARQGVRNLFESIGCKAEHSGPDVVDEPHVKKSEPLFCLKNRLEKNS